MSTEERNQGSTSETRKPCAACLEDLPIECFSKKQWQAKQLRRCKSCVESNKEMQKQAVVRKTDLPASATRKSRKKKDRPAFAGNMKSRYQPTPQGAEFTCKLSYDVCSWCGKSEESKELFTCSLCENILYCSKTCQKAAHPEHKLVCEKMKEDKQAYKAAKKERKKANKNAAKNEARSEASGVGRFNINISTLGAKGTLYFVCYYGELKGYEEPGQHFPTPQAQEGVKNCLVQQVIIV